MFLTIVIKKDVKITFSPLKDFPYKLHCNNIPFLIIHPYKPYIQESPLLYILKMHGYRIIRIRLFW